MNCKLKNPLKLKDCSLYPKGTPVSVSVKENKPTVAVLVIAGREIKIRSISLYRYFAEFDPVNLNSTIWTDCIVPSLTGESVEPDGWDEHGFPSGLLAAGVI